MTATTMDAVKSLYRAIENADGPALFGMLDPGFVGIVSEGMPAHAGGRYEGPEAMLAMWGGVARQFAIHPEPDEFIETRDGRIIVTGYYTGTARATGKTVNAAFAHVLEMRDGKLTYLRQITDTQRWVEALEQN